MADLAKNRKQRLRTLEDQIRENYEAFVQTGFALKEIRDDELYVEDGYATWDAYLKQRVSSVFGIEERQAYALVSSAQIRPKLPDLPAANCTGVQLGEWTLKAVNEFARLAPKDETRPGHPPDYDRLKKQDVQRVAKKVIEHCEAKGVKPTAPIVRKFVDADLGIDRGEQAKETKRRQEEAASPELHRFLIDLTGHIDGARENLEEVTDDVWELLGKSHAGVIRRLIAACDNLAGVLRKGHR